NGIAITEFAPVIDFDLKTRKALNHEFCGQPGVPARAAGDDAHVLKFTELLFRNGHLIQKDFSSVLRDAAEQGIANGARLLKNLLLHKVLVAALFRHDGVPGDVLCGALDGTAVVIHYPHTFRGENGNVAIRQEKHFARVLEEGRDVTSDEIFSFSETNHGRGA